MKLEITKNEEGKSIGYKLIAENLDEAKDLNFVRNVCFFSKFVYDGRVRNENFPDEAGDLSWITEHEHIKRLEEEGRLR